MPYVVFNGSKILIRKQITTLQRQVVRHFGCFQWFKDTNSKANHNKCIMGIFFVGVVFNGSKILIRKQITTIAKHSNRLFCCFQWFKDTNSKANHNKAPPFQQTSCVVFNGSKILIRKQITTLEESYRAIIQLFSMVQRY